MISIDSAAFGYPAGPVVLDDVSLELNGGEQVVLLGPNGGGKTTFFRALRGELPPRVGSVAVNAPVATLAQHDTSRVDFPVSALDVVLMGTISERRFWQRAGRAERTRARDALTRVGLGDQAERTFGELSGGQRRRVLLARTIVSEAPILALDEPLAGVDPHSAGVIRDALEQLAREGRLVIEASHNIEHARAADRVICVAGRVVADGDPRAVLTDSALQDLYAGQLTRVGDGTLLVGEDCAGHDHGDYS